MTLKTGNIDLQLANGQATTETVINYCLTSHYEGLHRFASNLLNDGDMAEDVVQKSILRAAHSINQYKPHSNFRAWLYRITLNETRAVLRKRKRQQRLETTLKRVWRNKTAPSPESKQIADESKQQIWAALQLLKEKHRVPIILRYFEELSAGEIAEVLELPIGTVYSRLHYAHNKLFGLLSAQEVTE